MKEDWETFGRSLDSATSPRLQKAVAETVALMGGSVDTVDTLVQQLYGGQLDPQIGGVYFRHPRAQTATLAITAAFLAKGNKLWEVGFARYREFLYQLTIFLPSPKSFSQSFNGWLSASFRGASSPFNGFCIIAGAFEPGVVSCARPTATYQNAKGKRMARNRVFRIKWFLSSQVGKW
jgi:hypothetical protein